MPVIYVTGHRNPDTDSIAAAIGYAELKRRIDPRNDYVPVRLGDVNAQTRWVLDRSEAPEPELLEHVLLRAGDVMREDFPVASVHDAVRTVGLTMAGHDDLELVPVVDDDGQLAGVVTERVLARRYIRESRTASSLVDAATSVKSVVDILEAEILCGDEKEVAGRVWAYAQDVTADSAISPGDVVVVGDRPEAQKRAIELGAVLLVLSNGSQAGDEVKALAKEHGTTVISSPLDTYVSSRMITLAAPCRAVMDREPFCVRPDDLASDVADLVKDIHYRAAVVVDERRKPVGLVTTYELVNPRPRRVLLVDHAEAAQSVPGVEQAEIVEILDHHHIGSIETRVPVTATFDPVGSTATLVVERFRQNGMEPSRPSAFALLGAVLSDTVILNSPTTTERDRAVVDYLGRVLASDPVAFGREMFETTSDVSSVPAEKIINRDAKEYTIGGGQKISIAQIETVGKALLERKDELRQALRDVQHERGYLMAALMITDIMEHSTDLLIAGDLSHAERAFGREAHDGGIIELPGVMSRKKQVAPVLLGAG